MLRMTGYAWREQAAGNISVSVEIKSYNNRFLEIYVNAPPWLSGLEGAVRERIAAVCGRGKVEVSIRLREHNAPLVISLNTTAAAAYLNAARELAGNFGSNGTLGLAELFQMEGVLEVERNRDDARYWQALEPVLEEALAAFIAERQREGKHTENDILKSLGVIETNLETVKSFSSTLEESIKENIRSRFADVLGDQIDENRVLAETAVLLMKYTIAEEISRLASHLAEFRAETAGSSRPGKKLDFICQELNREINTIGSKSALLEVSRAVVAMKEALENIREQLRNVE
jgi:uncharacterized protein (TIGR00255 family)